MARGFETHTLFKENKKQKPKNKGVISRRGEDIERRTYDTGRYRIIDGEGKTKKEIEYLRKRRENAIKKAEKKMDDWIDTGEFQHLSGVQTVRGLFRELLLDYYGRKCSICEIGESWNGKELVLILDHINGDSLDNREENLRFVCPNCDSQLPTYKSKNRDSSRTVRRRGNVQSIGRVRGNEEELERLKELKEESKEIKEEQIKEEEDTEGKENIPKKGDLECVICSKRITRSVRGKYNNMCSICYTENNLKHGKIRINGNKFVFIEELWRKLHKYSFTEVGDIYGVSDNAVRKWCKKFGMPTKAKFYKTEEKDTRFSNKMSKIVKEGDRNKVPIRQYELEGNFVREYESISQASKITGINGSNIMHASRGYAEIGKNRLTAGGFKWERVDNGKRDYGVNGSSVG